jgi:hypothetical protein
VLGPSVHQAAWDRRFIQGSEPSSNRTDGAVLDQDGSDMNNAASAVAV